MTLKNFDWNEQAIDTIVSEDSRYTTYDGYGLLNYPIDVQTAAIVDQPLEREELTSL